LTVGEKNRRNLAVYALRCSALADGLRQMGVTVEADQWRDGHPWYAWMRDLDAAVTQLEDTIRPGSSFILVDDATWSDGWDQTEILPDRHTRPFLEQQGSYWGPPTDDQHAIAELERMRGEGSRFFVVAWPSFWWLDHYVGFREHLERNYHCVIRNPQLVAFDLADAS
jgi:hypothetical protein